MDKRIRLTALTLAASLLLNMVVLPVHAEEETAPSFSQMSQENEPTEGPTAAETVPADTTAAPATEETEPAASTEETAAAETTEETNGTEETTVPEETEADSGLSLLAADVDVPVPVDNAYTINSLAQLVGLSTLPASDYADSTIVIVIKSGDLSTEQFGGLGSSDAPFAGKLIFNGDAEASLTLSRPLFNYLSTEATCTVNNSANGGYLQLTDNNAEGALLAQVLTGTGAGSSWKVAAYNSRADDVQPNSVPIIGTMEAGSAIDLSVKDGYWYPVQAANAGLLCGTMGENTKLTLEDYAQTAEKTTAYFVMATSGAAGGLVGKMGKGAALTLKPDLSFPEKTVQAAGAAGGLVGEMGEDAAVTVSGSLTCAGAIAAGGPGGSLAGRMGKNAQVTVTGDLTLKVTEVNADGSAGGLVGQMAEGSALSLPNTKTLTLSAAVSGSNAGGLVGEMKDGARLSGLSGSDKITVSGTLTATSGAAGGLIGTGENLLLDGGMPEVSARKITGESAAGGLIGSYIYSRTDGDYYNGSADYPAVTADLSDSGGHTGGLYGYVKNTAGDFFLKGTKDVSVTAAKGNHLGGLVGRYEADSLTEQSLYVNTGAVSLTGNGTDSFGGLIGSVTGDNGVCIEIQKAAPTCTVSGSAGNNAGGLIGKLEGGGHMVRLSHVSAGGLQGSSASGGLVGYMQRGVLYLGQDITIAQPGTGGKNGWVLGDRDNTLVYTDQDWNPKKGTTNDIGGWGQVVFADNLPGVLTYSAADRTVTVAAPNGSDGTYTVGNAAGFAELALRYQLNETHSLKFEGGDLDLNATQTINLTANVNYLEDVGFTGFQRDVNNAEQISVILNGSGRTVTLPDIPVYTGGSNHDRQGLFTRTANLTASDLTIDGTITAHADSALYIGVLCAETASTASLTKVTGSTAVCVDGNGGESRISGLLATAQEAAFTDCTWNGSILDSTGSNSCIGGFYAQNSNAGTKITVKNGTLSGSIEKAAGWSDARVGGLAASLSTVWYGDDHTLTVDGLNVDGLRITTGSSSASGGLLGYEWMNTQASITGVSVRNSTLKAGTNARFGGLVYTGSGYWRVEQGTAAEPYGIHFAGGNTFTGKSEQNAPSGLIAARGERNGMTALYLEIREDAYKAEAGGSTVNIGGSQYFDEILGSSQSTSGNGVVSIALPGHALINRDACNTYRSQLGQTWKNGKTRYYYNLDQYRDENPDFGGTVDSPEKMMLWDAFHDCETGLRKYFAQAEDYVITGEINLKGYSFYPTYYIGDTTISGAFITFDYDPINNVETGKSNKPLDDPDSQHYLMHTGIFSGGAAVSSGQTLSVNNLTLAGTVGPSATGTGVLCCGPFSGSSSTAKMTLAIQNVNLQGIRISGVTDGTQVCPLLIDSLGSYTTLDMNGVKTTTGYEDLNADGTKYAASSLIGKVGGDSGKEIRLTFQKMCLDGRPGRNNDVLYGTTGCIFDRALFLESFDYVESSSGVYNFTEAEKDACTLGRELSNAAGGPVSGRNNDEQCWYYGGALENKYVCGSAAQWETAYENYMRYVNQQEDTSDGSTQHELDINLNALGLEEGCGTKNDPYIIRSFSQLRTLNLVLQQGYAQDWPVNLDADVLANVINGVSFQDAEDDQHTAANVNGRHESYTYYQNSSWRSKSGKTVISWDYMRTYLQNAHYELRNDIEADAAWEGLGLLTGGFVVAFGGDIDGQGHTFTVPGSTASQSGGLVKYSMGSVIRNINVQYTGSISLTCDTVPSAVTDPVFFGGVVGYAFSGETIVDNVKVTYAQQPKAAGNFSFLAAVGGYVGLVGGATPNGSNENDYGGGVIFRGKIGTGLTGGNAQPDNSKYYYNPYVGRVLDGYVLGDGVSLNNTEKNYQIPNISSSTPIDSHLAITVNTSAKTATATVKDAQGLWLLSAIANSGAAAMGKYKAYSIGHPRTGEGDDSCLGVYRDTLKTNKRAASNSYLSRYVSAVFGNLADDGLKLTVEITDDCDMTGYGNGFRGIGCSYITIRTDTPTKYRQLCIQTVNGNGHTITLAQQRNEYEAEKNSWTAIGSGLFVALRNGEGSRFSDLTLTGSTGITYLNNSGKLSVIVGGSDGLWTTVRAYKAGAGMLISGLCAKTGNSVTLERIQVKNAKVNAASEEDPGSVSAGGIVGQLGFSKQMNADAVFRDCGYENLTVHAIAMAGGFVGYAAPKNLTVSISQDTTLSDGAVRTYHPNLLSVEGASRQEAAGMFGHIHSYDVDNGSVSINADGEHTLRLENLTVKGGVNRSTNNVGGLIGYVCIANGKSLTIRNVQLEGDVTLSGSTSSYTKANVAALVAHLGDYSGNTWTGTFSNYKFTFDVSNVRIGCEAGSNIRLIDGNQMGSILGITKNPGGTMTFTDICIGSEQSNVSILLGSKADTWDNSGNGTVGGLVGLMRLYPSVMMEDIRLNHVILAGAEATGGLVGKIQNESGSTGDSYTTRLRMTNVAVENSVIAGSKISNTVSLSVGGLYGRIIECGARLTGVNILLKDNQIGYLLNGSSYQTKVPNTWDGTAAVGFVNGDSYRAGIFGGQRVARSGYTHTLKFTGVSLQQAENTVPAQDFGTALGDGDYLVRSDYTGVQDGDTTLSEYPHVTTNPVSSLTELLDGLLDTDEKVTGDGACFVGDSTVAIGEKIRSDSSGTENRNLTHTAVEEARKYLTDAAANRPADMAYFGSFTGDGDNAGYDGGNFPVFVISTTSTDEANRALYSALSLLTNRVMYGQTITGDLNPDAPADMTLSLTNYVYSGGRWQESAEDGSFILNEATKRIRLNGQYDNQKARFTLVKAKFADPADASRTAYTLYLPVMIKKVFNFRFWASALTGTSYIQSNYDDLSRLAIASDNEKVTALLGFDYTRTREEWQKAVDDGENLLWNFLKQIRLNVSLPADTRLVLVDRNNRDKAWYATAANALEQVDSYYELKFTAFRESLSGTSESWSPVTLSQLLPLTARELTSSEKADETRTGKFVLAESADTATVQIGESYYRKATDEDKSLTQYAITVGEFSGELSERYYLTLQTPVDNQQLLNILLTCDDRLTNPAGNGLPTKRLNASDANPNNGFARNRDENRIVITSCFEQEVSLTTAEGQLEMISDSNTQVEADLTATIRFKDAVSAQQFQYYAGDQSLSQCFNLVFYRYEGSTKTRVNLTPGTQITAVYRYGEQSWTERYIVDTSTRFYRLTFPTEIPCSDIQEHSVELTAKLTLDFSASYADQFPIREGDSDRTGILMAVSSTLSYTPRTLTSSTLSTQPPSEDTRDRHFYRGEVSVASLNYDAVGDTEMDSINQLGINGFEGSPAELRSAASYNVSAVSRADSARYLRCTLTLSPRNNTGTQPFVSYGAAVPWGKCLTGEKMQLSLNYAEAESGRIVVAANPTNTEDNVNAVYTATFRLDSVLDKSVPLEISADMSLLAGTALEAGGMTYANYKIRLEVELLDENQNAISGSNASDYLVYTNSRIYRNIVPKT